MNESMKYGHLVVAGLFLLFAFFQLNDPDPWGWVVVYSWVGIVALLTFWRKPQRKWMALLGLIGVIGAGIYLFPGFQQWVSAGAPSLAGEMSADQPEIEYAREFLGLLLCGLVLSAYVLSGRRALL